MQPPGRWCPGPTRVGPAAGFPPGGRSRRWRLLTRSQGRKILGQSMGDMMFWWFVWHFLNEKMEQFFEVYTQYMKFMAHMLHGAGISISKKLGDFFRANVGKYSSTMVRIWLGKNKLLLPGRWAKMNDLADWNRNWNWTMIGIWTRN